MKRENNIDALRVLACFMVIVAHIASYYVDNYIKIVGSYFEWGNFYDSLSRASVPIFVLIAGRYALLELRNMDWQNYYIRIWKKIYMPTCIWSIIYIGISVVEKDRTLYEGIVACIYGSPYYHMWYLFMAIGLYLLTPFFIRLRLTLEEQNFRKIGYIFLILGIFLSVIYEVTVRIQFFGFHMKLLKYFWGGNQFRFLNYIGYYILGYSLAKVKLRLKFCILGTVIFLMATYLAMDYFRNPIVYDNNLPLIMGGAFFIYFTFNNLEFKYNFSKLSKHTFNIYLIHAMIIAVLNFGIRVVFKLNPSPIWYIPLATVVVFIISLMFSIGLEKILRYIK